MTYFDWFMAIIGLIDVAALIFWIVCEVKPEVLYNDKIREGYEFIIGHSVDVKEIRTK